MKEILKDLFKKQALRNFCAIIFIAINAYFFTLPSKILGIIIDLLYNIENNKLEIYKYVFLLILSALGIIIVRVAWKYLISCSTRELEKKLKDKIFEQFLQIKLSSIQNIKNGEIMSYLVKDVGEIRGFCYRMFQAIRIFFAAVTAIYAMKNVNGKLTIFSLCPIIVTVIVIIVIKKYIEICFKKSQKYFTAMSEYVQESTDAIRTTKAYSGEINQYKKFVKKNSLLKKSNIAVDVYTTLLSCSVNICFGICYVIIIIFGSKLVMNGDITVGQLVAFSGYISLFATPINWIPGIISKFERASISYKRLDNVFSLEKELLTLDEPKKDNSIYGDIEIKNLSFTYPECSNKVLDGINITIKKGETLGIIGTIGSGKTTLMNLLLRLYDVPENTIFIKGKDINSIELSKLRNNISYITQDNFLFSTTIKENITLFRDDFDEEELLKSTRNSMISEEINNMKDGINTIIGERGIDLSGGQKQRVVISRAFLNKSKFLIFDDTFSALDNKTEEKLLKNIKELSKDKICIIISNRISDVKDANHIIVLDNGKIVEEGKHSELLKNKKLYNKFYNQQSSKKELLA